MKATLYDYPNGKVYDVTELFNPDLPRKVYGMMRNDENIREIVSDIESTERIIYIDPDLSTVNANITLPGYAAVIKVISGTVIIDKIVVNAIKLLNKRKIKSYLIDNGIPPAPADEIAGILIDIAKYAEMDKEKVFEEILTELSGVM